MVALDRLLVKFFYTGHRVLLFSTMTRYLDLMQVGGCVGGWVGGGQPPCGPGGGATPMWARGGGVGSGERGRWGGGWGAG